MQSSAKTVKEYIDEVPADRLTSFKKVRSIIKKNLPAGYIEVMQYGYISYVVPLKLYPKGYLDKKDVPIPAISLASQKNYMALYLMCTYQDEALLNWFQEEYKKTGKKMDMGKGCIRFKSSDDLPLELIGKVIGKMSVKKFIENYEKERAK